MKNLCTLFLFLVIYATSYTQSTNCSLYDTVYSGALRNTAATGENIVITKHIQTNSRAYLFGTATSNSGGQQNLLMAIQAHTGQPLWCKKWQTQPQQRGLLDVVLLNNYLYSSDALSGTATPAVALTKWDTLGNRLWTKQISLTNLPPGTIINAYTPLLDTNGNRLALSINLQNLTSPLFDEGICAMELDSAGNKLWAKQFGFNTATGDYLFVNNKPLGIKKTLDGTADYLLFTVSGGRPFDDPANQPKNRYRSVLATRFSPNGRLYTARYYLPIVTINARNLLVAENKDAQSTMRLQNGNFLLATNNVNGSTDDLQNARFFFELNDQLQACNGVLVSCKRYEIFSSPFVLPSGKIILTDQKNIEESFSVAVIQNRLLQEEKKYPKSPLFTRLQNATLGQYITRSPVSEHSQISLLFHSNGTGTSFTEMHIDNEYVTRPACGYRNVQERKTTPVNTFSSPIRWDTIFNVITTVSNLSVQQEVVQPQFQSTCGVSSRCDSVVVLAPDTICPGQHFSVIVRKNADCFKDIQLFQSPNVQLVSIPNDSTYIVTINQRGMATFTARFKDCANTLATKQVFVAESISPVGLLPFHDTTICSGQTVLLPAVSGLQFYNWNNGASFSQNFTAHTAGRYTVSAQNYCGVTFKDSVVVKVDTTQLHLTPTSVSVCVGDTATFTIQPVGQIHQFRWQPSSYAIIDSVNGLFKAWPVQNTSYVVKGLTQKYCPVTDTAIVGVNHKPATATILPQQAFSFCKGDSLLLSTIQSFSRYRWSNNDTSRNTTIQTPGNYSIAVADQFNCIELVSFIVRDSICTEAIYFPTAFTPNGDGLNDVFRPILKGRIPQRFSLKITNRWGQTIFGSNTYSNGWDGKINGILQPCGAYIYRCRYFYNNIPYTLNGNVTLIR